MPRKPDRFERETAKINFRLHATAPWLITEPQALRLLRKEHRWVERLVKQHLELWSGCAPRGQETNQYGRDCRAAQCREILSALKQRRK